MINVYSITFILVLPILYKLTKLLFADTMPSNPDDERPPIMPYCYGWIYVVYSEGFSRLILRVGDV